MRDTGVCICAGMLHRRIRFATLFVKLPTDRERDMFSLLKALFTPINREPVTPQASVNCLYGSSGMARYDGTVLSVDGDRALVEWPKGVKTFEKVDHLTLILD